MREFGIGFSKGLRKGLRAFITSIPREEQLIECYNWMPHEYGLIAHEELVGIPDPIIVPSTTFPGVDTNGLVYLIHPPPV